MTIYGYFFNKPVPFSAKDEFKNYSELSTNYFQEDFRNGIKKSVPY